LTAIAEGPLRGFREGTDAERIWRLKDALVSIKQVTFFMVQLLQMSASNFRVHECNTVHHLISRIAHKVFFLGDEERNDFLVIVRRSAAFSGVQLLGWRIMTNHFHLLVHLPPRIELNEEEILRRYQILKGEAGRFVAEEQLKYP